jgi:hypothetical protein
MCTSGRGAEIVVGVVRASTHQTRTSGDTLKVWHGDAATNPGGRCVA